jgi:DNA-binding beta-propeller fold protein YncE
MKDLLKIATILIVSIIIGCAAPQKKQESFTLFYPPPPELPRLQWLTAFTGAWDVEQEKSGFDKFVTGEGADRRRLDKPYGVALYDGKIYVCDTNRTVMVFDLKKRTFGPLEGAKGAGKLVQPLNVSIDKAGNKYVTDPVRGQVVVFDKNDLYVKAFGSSGGWKPVDAAVLGDSLYVADIKNGAVVVFDMNTGQIVKKIGRTGNPTENLYMPTNITFDSKGVLYISDTGRFEILKYDRDGHYLGSIGKLGTTPGTFARPKGVATDRENRLYVVDASFDNVQIFAPEGNVLLWFGQFGKTGLDPGNFYLPAQVAIDYDNVQYFEKYADPKFEIEYLVLVTSQFGDNMVNVFGYGKEKGKKYPSYEELRKQVEEKLQKMRNELAPKESVIKKEEK